MKPITLERRADNAGKRFRIRVRVGRVANPAEEYVVVYHINGVNSASEAIDTFCAMNTSYLMHSRDYFLVDFAAEEMK